MSTQMHENSIAKVKNIIREIVVNQELKEGAPYFGYKKDPFKKIAVELNKRKTEFEASDLTCELIFRFAVENFSKKNSILNINGLSSKTKNEIDEFVDEVFECYNNTPFKYQIEFKLQHLPLLIEINNQPILNVETKYSIKRTGLGAYDDVSILKIKSEGFFSGLYPESFMKDIYQKLKVMLFLLDNHQVSKSRSSMYKSMTFSSFMEGYAIGNAPYTAVVKNLTHSYMDKNIILPFDISKYLHDITFNSTVNSEYRNEKTTDAFLIANLLLSNKSKEAMRIKTAIDWLVQSDITDDDTMSFIQICMGLESIFGDDDYEVGLTSVLSDRCAYLIGKNIDNRKKIKEIFKKIYQIRSKIIHGVRNHLSESEDHFRYIAHGFLEQSIIREIDNLELTNQQKN